MSLEISALVKGFLDHCALEKGLDHKTVSAYETDLTQFIEFSHQQLKSKTIDLIKKEQLKQYLRELNSKFKPKTVKRKIASLKAFFNLLEFEDIIPSNPIRKVKTNVKDSFTLPTYLTLAEIKRIFDLVRKDIEVLENRGDLRYIMAVRDLAILELMFACGLRVSELCRVKMNEIDLEEGVLLIKGKGGKDRQLVIGNSETISILRKYDRLISRRRHVPEIFFVNRNFNPLRTSSVRHLVKKYSQAAHINKPVTPHTFRHSFATLLMEEGVDIKYIQQFLGHSSIMTTQIYTHVSKRKQEEILLEKHPRGKI